MSIIVQNIRLHVDKTDRDAIAKAAKQLGIPGAKGVIYKKAVDSRRKDITFVYSVAFSGVEGEEKVVAKKHDPNIVLHQEQPLEIELGQGTMKRRPVICGFGPAGMFAGLLLSQQGYRPIIFEGGSDVDTRVKKIETYWKGGPLDERCNVQFGEGGAGTFSDGKLTTRIGDSRCRYVLGELVRFGAPQEILTLAKPHIGTDQLRLVVKHIRQEILRLGGEIHFDDKLVDIKMEQGKLTAVKTTQSGWVETNHLILAIGHSARDTYEMLLQKGFFLEPKPFSVGVRAEHLQQDIDRMMYKEYAGHPHLKPAEYQLSHREGDLCCYSFCMCPGGTVVAAASEAESICTNGMSYYKRDGQNANSAIVVSVDPAKFEGDSPLRGMYFQRQLEQKAYQVGHGHAPLQRLGDLMDGRATTKLGKVKPTYTGEVTLTDLHQCLPAPVIHMMKQGFGKFDRRMQGFAHPDTLLTGVETRTSAPVRIKRGETLESIRCQGVYPCGEGAGYAGGIMSAAVDGLRVATAMMKQQGPPRA